MFLSEISRYEVLLNLRVWKQLLNIHIQGATVISMQGMEHAEKELPSKVAEHIDMYSYHTNKAANLMQKLFDK